MISLLIVDDHKMVRQGLRHLLEAEPDFRVIGEAGDGPAGLRLTESLKPDVLITDLRMEEMDGIEVTRRARLCSPDTRIIVLTMHLEAGLAREALQAGASGYVIKSSAIDELNEAVRSVASGGQFLSPELSDS
jgi:NarL family two-component system response regulator LiaR